MIIRDQIHGDIEFSDAEMKLINSKSFERMRYIKQLAFADYEYPCAVHTRYQHSLGVCKCITDMYNAVVKNCPDFYREGDLELLRMMALVHDLGHSPFSHASEELSNITHEERLTDILQLEKSNIILAHDYDIESWDLVNQVYMGDGLVYFQDKHLIALHSFMDGFIDADKLDYLERDSANCGVGYGRFDRESLINNLTIVRGKNGIETLGILNTGVQALESFILARYYMFSQVYFNPRERILRYQYCNEMKTLLPNGKYPDDIIKFLKLDDTKFSRKLKFIKHQKYELVYDSEFNIDLKYKIDRKLGNLVLCDMPRKTIFRRDKDDANILIYNPLSDTVIECGDASPILSSIQYLSLHKLRYYAEVNVANEVRQEINKIVKAVIK